MNDRKSRGRRNQSYVLSSSDMWRWTFHLQICEDEVSSSDMWRWAPIYMHVASKCYVFSEWTLCFIGGRHITRYFSPRNLIPSFCLFLDSISASEGTPRVGLTLWILIRSEHSLKTLLLLSTQLKSSEGNEIGVSWICCSSKQTLGRSSRLSELDWVLRLKF